MSIFLTILHLLKYGWFKFKEKCGFRLNAYWLVLIHKSLSSDYEIQIGLELFCGENNSSLTVYDKILGITFSYFRQHEKLPI